MNAIQRTTLLAATLVLSGCAVNGFSMSSVEPQVGREVRAETSVFNVLGFNPTTVEEIDALRASLSEQCGDQGVTGVTTLSWTIFAIIGVVERSQVIGYCVE